MRQLQAICAAIIVAALCAGAAQAQVTTAITSDSTAFHVFNTGSTSDLLRVQSNSFVGIGTTTPGVLLDLKGSNQPYGGQLRLQGTDFDQITFYNSANPAQNGTNRMGFIYYDVVNDLLGIDNEAGNKYLLLNQTGGNVGIGTTTPPAILTTQKANATTFLGLSGDSGSYTDIGLGRATIEARLGVAANDAGQYAVTAKHGDVVLRVDDSSKRLLLLAGSGNAVMTITNANVGINSDSPTARLQIGSIMAPVQFLDMSANGRTGMKLNMAGNSEIDVAGLKIGDTAMPTINVPGGTLYLQNNGGSVNIGNGTQANLSVTGSITATGTVTSTFQDVAEWVPSSEQMPPGTVVIVSETDNTVAPSTAAYDTRVAGVVSAAPGVLLGVESSSKSKIATTGRVKVRVDATKAAIHRGDLLVTSDKPGLAMKSEPLDLGGVKIHRPGTLIGKALEPLPSGQGEILVLLSLQ